MAEGAVFECCDFMGVGPVLAGGAEPAVEVEESLARGNAHWELGVTARA